MNDADATPTPESDVSPADDAKNGMDASELARKGAIVVALLVTVVALFVAFQAVTDAIRTWLEPRWVPIWRALFALAVAGLAVYVVKRLTE